MNPNGNPEIKNSSKYSSQKWNRKKRQIGNNLNNKLIMEIMRKSIKTHKSTNPWSKYNSKMQSIPTTKSSKTNN
jgi:hypothetical protein